MRPLCRCFVLIAYDFFALNRTRISRSGCQYNERRDRLLYEFGCHAATQWQAKSAWMHDNAIHDLPLAYWSELLSPIKRPCNQNEPGELGKLLRLVVLQSQHMQALRSRRWQVNRQSNHDRCCRRALPIRTPMLTEAAAKNASIKNWSDRRFGPTFCYPRCTRISDDQ